jgi:hypothetical protein
LTAVELAQLLALVAAVLALAALVLLFVLHSRLKRLQRQQRVILGNRGETDIIGHVSDLDEKVDHLRMAMEDLAVTAKDHEVRIDGCLARLGMVRFDAYEDLGGRQSTSVAFLDSRENGLVLTTVVSREFARMYVKSIKDGRADVPLAPEETEALDQARSRGAGPFVLRPRLQQILDEKGIEVVETEPEPTPEDPDEEQAALRALERENRRRVRRGLPPLDELPPAPSTLGWAALQQNGGGAPGEQAEEGSGGELPPGPTQVSDLKADGTEEHVWAPDWEDQPSSAADQNEQS